MPETSIQSPPGFNELPKAEQVRYLQALWDQISANPDEVPVPESHLQLAEERLRRYRENPATATSAFAVRVVLETVEEQRLSTQQQRELWREWVERGPEGPIEDGIDTDIP